MASADLVIGQPDFTSNGANQDGDPAANTLISPTNGLYATDNQLFVMDGNNRILIFNDVTRNPSLTLNRSPQTKGGGLLRFNGTATTDSPNTTNNVEFAINNGGFAGATASDGGFDEFSEDFYFDFNPSLHQATDEHGKDADGYTIQIKSTNNNTDVTDHLFHFTPFNLNQPAHGATVTDGHWTLMHAGKHAPAELYDIDSDPAQAHDLRSQQADVAARLHSDYVDYMEKLGTEEDKLALRREYA